MRNITGIFAIFLFAISFPGTGLAQYSFFEPKVGFAIEVSLPNTDLKRLPMYRNAITSLIVLDDQIIGGTSAEEGLSPFIFVASLTERELIAFRDLDEVVPGQQKIQTGFCLGKNQELFAGTLPNKNKNGPGEGGHLLSVKVNADAIIEVKDLGIPVPGEGILALLADKKVEFLYGISYPSGLFFRYNITEGKVKIYEDIAPKEKEMSLLDEYDLSPEKYLCKALIEDEQGIIYGSLPINKVFYFDPKLESFDFLKDGLPEVWGRRTLGQVESWAKSEKGILYGGNAGDGQLFRIDPNGKKLENLGKPIMMNRLRGLAFGKDGNLYGIAGGQPGYAHLFSYDPERGGYLDFGNPEFVMVAPGIEQGIRWRGFQLGTITASENGNYIVMGEDEALSQLLVFEVEEAMKSKGEK